MGLFLDFAGVPTPRLTGCGDHADHRLAARMDRQVERASAVFMLTLTTIAWSGMLLTLGTAILTLR
jgi:hypothetical protein